MGLCACPVGTELQRRGRSRQHVESTPLPQVVLSYPTTLRGHTANHLRNFSKPRLCPPAKLATHHASHKSRNSRSCNVAPAATRFRTPLFLVRGSTPVHPGRLRPGPGIASEWQPLYSEELFILLHAMFGLLSASLLAGCRGDERGVRGRLVLCQI